ncbi:hypothetical protein TRAPUB_4325 [Trametes pubescens]|uniref:Expansin-like EG45 domain-containing protein n=1 Tax=Trametes pubescens TaxID=154538 RepID=A0A1M2W7D9_TRAPU|nr:hypothetical protein TRAPUB_4325 [Trametes pubescens]
MSQFAYGSSTAYGPGCGRCFKITLLNTYTSTPPFIPNVTKSVVIKDFGVWNVSYTSVDCLTNWAGAKSAAALGSVDDGSSVCCPANPTSLRDWQGSTNDTCPSYSDDNGIPCVPFRPTLPPTVSSAD